MLALVALVASSSPVLVLPLSGDAPVELRGALTDGLRDQVAALGFAVVSKSATADRLVAAQALGVTCKLELDLCVAQLAGLASASMGVGGTAVAAADGSVLVTVRAVDAGGTSRGRAQLAVPREGPARAKALALLAVRLLAPAREQGTLVVSVRPPSAAVVVDGAKHAPGSIAVNPGKHELYVALPGYASDTRSVTVEYGEAVRVDVELEREGGVVPGDTPVVPVEPPTAEVEPDTARPRVLVLDVRADVSDEATAAVVRDRITLTLTQNPGIDVVSSEDLRRLTAGTDHDAAGCADEACFVAVSAAVGARYVARANMTHVGDLRVVQLSLFDTEHARALGRESAQARSEPALVDAVGAASSRLGNALAPLPSSRAALSSTVWIGGAVAGVGVLGAAACGTLIALAYGPATDESGSTSAAARTSAQQLGAASSVGAAIAGAVALAGFGVLVWGLAAP